MNEVALITGGGGFLGKNLSSALIAQGWDVHITSRIAAAAAGQRITNHCCDFADFDAGREIVHALMPDVIYHLAGAVSAKPDIELVLPTFQSLLSSSVNLLTIVAEIPATRLVLIGSLNEGTGQAPTSPYGAAKAATRIYARMFRKLYTTNCVTVRPFMTFGPHQNPSKVLPYVIQSLSKGETPNISSGEWAADWIYVDDVIEGMRLAGQAAAAEGAEIDLGRGELVSLRDMVMNIQGMMGSEIAPSFGARDDRPDEPEHAANITTGKKILGWQPTTTLEDGLRKTIAFYSSED